MMRIGDAPRMLTRRHAAAALAGLFCPWPLFAAEQVRIHVTKDPNCGCCSGWVDHLRASGFDVSVSETPRVSPLKTRLGIPHELWACHTAQTGRYAIEGHVPAWRSSASCRSGPKRPVWRFPECRSAHREWKSKDRRRRNTPCSCSAPSDNALTGASRAAWKQPPSARSSAQSHRSALHGICVTRHFSSTRLASRRFPFPDPR